MRRSVSTGVSRFSRYPRIVITLSLLLAITAATALAISGLARQRDNNPSNGNIAQNATVSATSPPTIQAPLIPDPVATAVLPTVPPTDTATSMPKPLWDLESLSSNASVVGEAQIIGSESRPNSFTFIFYVHDWYKNEPGVKDNIVRLTLDTSRNWDKLVYLPRNFIGSTNGPEPFRFVLFLRGTPDNYSIVGDTVGIFFLREDTVVETGVGAEQYQHMPIQQFKEKLRALLHITPTPLPATSTPLPTPADGRPVSLIKEGDNYLVYPHRGIVRFGVGGVETWLGPARLRVLWSSGKEPYEGAAYVVDLQSGTLEKYNPTPEWYGRGPYGSVLHPNGKRVLLLKGATEDVWGLTLYDVTSKQEHTVFDRDPSVPQWAGADVHGKKSAGTPGTPIWLSDDLFLLAVGPGQNSQVQDPELATILLVNAASHEVRVLAKRVEEYTTDFGAPVIYQIGGISGALMMLPPPYASAPITLAPGGPWIRDWTATPDGSRVAWVEATAPPGDWSERLPSPCIPCNSYGSTDPEPQVEAIAIWDAVTRQVYRHKPSGLVWSLGSAFRSQQGAFHWLTGGSALLYATHASAPTRSTLYSLSPGEQPVLLAEHPWDGTVNVLGHGAEGSIYYYVTGKNYFASGDIVRRHPDGKLEVLHEYLSPNMWHLQQGKWLEVLGKGEVYVHDFATGQTRHARFRADSPSPGELDWSGTAGLVPLSPDGTWAAYAGASDDLMSGPPRPMPDRGPAIQIVRVK